MSSNDDNGTPRHEITAYTVSTPTSLFNIDLLMSGFQDPDSDHDIYHI